MHGSRSCFFGEDRHPTPHTWHTYKSQDVAFSFFLPKNQECWSHPCPSKTPGICDPQLPHPSVTEEEISAFLQNVKFGVPSTSALRSRSPDNQLPPLGFHSLALSSCTRGGLGPPGSSFPCSLVSPCLACCLQASQGPLLPLHSRIQIHGSQPQTRLWLRPQPHPRAQRLSSSALGSFSLSQNTTLGGP